MRAWFKCAAFAAEAARPEAEADEFAYHAWGMGGYDADPTGYATRDAFFSRYGEERFSAYAEAVRESCDRNDRILSTASGRCVTEMLLRAEGYDVHCSDLGRPGCLDATRALFPDIDFRELDLLAGAGNADFDAVLNFSCLYSFTPEQADLFFASLRSHLKPGGALILDPGGASDGLISRFLDDVVVPIEARLLRWHLQRRTGKPHVVRRWQQGYRWADADVIRMAERAGFRRCDGKRLRTDLEFQRSFIFLRLMSFLPFLRRVFNGLMPSASMIRLFVFEAV